MKKTSLLISSIIFLTTIFFTGCYDPVFYEVMNDVKPEEATVSGIINSISRFTVNDKEFLVLAANKGIRYKNVENEDHGSWKVVQSLPFETQHFDYDASEHKGQQIIKIMSDSSALYLITASYKNFDNLGTTGTSHISVWGNKNITLSDDGETWISSKNDWKCIVSDTDNKYFPFYFDSDYQISAFSVFQTNAPQKENRKAFIRSGDAKASSDDYKAVKYYELSYDGIKDITIAKVEDSETNNASSAVFFNDEYLFFNSIASTTNETYTKPATRIYYGNNEDLYYNSVAGEKGNYVSTLNAGNSISTIAVCSDAILIGRATYVSDGATAYGGIVKTTNTDGVPGSALFDFDTNAEFQLSSAYLINVIINATPDKSEKESSLYSSISFYGSGTSANVNFNNIGLWSYYPSRGNWNRE